MLMAWDAAPVYENTVAVSGGWGMVGATPEDRPVVAGVGAIHESPLQVIRYPSRIFTINAHGTWAAPGDENRH